MADRNQDSEHGAERKPITIAVVRRWLASEAAKWPALGDEDLRPVAVTCEQCRRAEAVRVRTGRGHGAHLAELQQCIRKARDGISAALAEMPTLWEQARAGLFCSDAVEALFEFERAAKRFRPFLTTRDAHRARRAWAPPAVKVSDHFRQVLGERGIIARVGNASGPLVRVITDAVCAVYGADIATTDGVRAVLWRAEGERKIYPAANDVKVALEALVFGPGKMTTESSGKRKGVQNH